MKRLRKQQHPHQGTNRSKKNATRSRTIHLEITPEQLVEKGNLQEAVHLLRAHIRTTPSDEKKRLLGQCLFQLGDSREAVQAWLAIQEKTAHDLALVGLAFLDLEEWEQAEPHLQASLQLEERGYCYYWLALAHKKSREDYQLEVEERVSILDLLRKACALPACPAEAFLWLDNLVRSAGNADERTTLLQEAFARYPNVEDVRLRLSDHLLYHLLNYEGALMMVKPLLAQPTPPQEAVACAFWAAQQAGLFEEALAYTEYMHVSPYRHCGPSMAKVKGDLYLIAGKTDEAITYYEQETQSGDFESMFIGYFSIAKARLTQWQVSKAAAAATLGATLWFANPNSSQCDGVFDPEPFSIGTETDQAYIGEHFSKCVKEVCEALLAEEQGAERSLKGQLSYLLYHYYTEYRPNESGETLTELLLQAAQWFEHPHISQALSYHYLRTGDVPLAVRHHLMYCLWQFSTLKTYQPLPPVSDDTDESRSGRWYKRQWEFRSSTAEFTIDDETEEDEGAAQQIQDMSVDVRHECHEIAWKFLQAHQDSDIIIAVFLPFYRSFWHDILVAGDMSQELVNVLAILLDVSPAADTDDELWSYAYTLSELERADEAECAYRSYLKRHPDHAATLHNLALLVKERGLLQEALALSNQAAALAPNNEIIVQVNSSLKREYEERERPHRNTAEQDQLRTSSQERAHLWSCSAVFL